MTPVGAGDVSDVREPVDADGTGDAGDLTGGSGGAVLGRMVLLLSGLDADDVRLGRAGTLAAPLTNDGKAPTGAAPSPFTPELKIKHKLIQLI